MDLYIFCGGMNHVTITNAFVASHSGAIYFLHFVKQQHCDEHMKKREPSALTIMLKIRMLLKRLVLCRLTCEIKLNV